MKRKGRIRPQEEVLTAFKKTHGDRYDYSRVVYVHSKRKVVIGCRDHGWFKQTPNNHQKGVHCPSCGRTNRSESRKNSLEKVIQQFRSVHGDRYDYSKIESAPAHTKVTIGCKVHGWFEQDSSNHKSGAGCSKCTRTSDSIRYEQDDVIASFKKAHGDMYDYSRVLYTNNTTKVVIGCPVHGWFEQRPKDHKRGIGCAQCGPDRGGKARKITLKEFIRRSRVHHGSKFDYSLVDLDANDIFDRVKIVCPTHGVTEQIAYNHYNGYGCKKCDGKRVSAAFKLSQNEFISRCILKHGNKYDYSKTVYTGSHETVCVTCKKHGDFQIIATLHSTGGNGCHKCWRSKGEHIIASWLDVRGIAYVSEHKFDDCLTPKGRKMKFDFYLPSFNTLIEFDGEQHYVASDMFGGEKGLKLVRKYDAIKNRYAKKKGIRLIRIPFFKRSSINEVLALMLNHTTAA